MGTNRWPKGQSGNPAGRPKGVPNRLSIASIRERFTEGQLVYLDAVARKNLEIVFAGDELMLAKIGAPQQVWHGFVTPTDRLRAIKIFYDHTLGRPASMIEIIDTVAGSSATATSLITAWEADSEAMPPILCADD